MLTVMLQHCSHLVFADPLCVHTESDVVPTGRLVCSSCTIKEQVFTAQHEYAAHMFSMASTALKPRDGALSVLNYS